MNISDKILALDGMAVANVNEPSEGDLERVLNQNIEFKQALNAAQDAILDVLANSDQVLNEECKLKMRAFLKLYDERVKNGPQGPKVP